MNDFYGVPDQMMEQHKKHMDQIIMQKLEYLSQKAYLARDYFLYETLRDIDPKRLEKTTKKLTDAGYQLEIKHPIPDFSYQGDTYKATINTNDVKVIVRKKILEA